MNSPMTASARQEPANFPADPARVHGNGIEWSMSRFGPLLGRVLIASIYLISGVEKVAGFGSTVEAIASKNLPLPELAAIGSIVVEVGCGTMLVMGWKSRWAAVALFGFTALAGLIFHNFWAVPAAEAANQMTHFLKNICILGGLLYVFIYGSGPLSIDGRSPIRSTI